MGLPGSGKTTLALALLRELSDNNSVDWINADDIRKKYNDWDFTIEGRLRQAYRMYELASVSTTDYVMADFVAPLTEMREIFAADWTIWVDTLAAGRFEDTNSIFERPVLYDFHVTEQDADAYAHTIGNHIKSNYARQF
jgi:adenylylsulfate kinase